MAYMYALIDMMVMIFMVRIMVRLVSVIPGILEVRHGGHRRAGGGRIVWVSGGKASATITPENSCAVFKVVGPRKYYIVYYRAGDNAPRDTDVYLDGSLLFSYTILKYSPNPVLVKEVDVPEGTHTLKVCITCGKGKWVVVITTKAPASGKEGRREGRYEEYRPDDVRLPAGEVVQPNPELDVLCPDGTWFRKRLYVPEDVQL